MVLDFLRVMNAAVLYCTKFFNGIWNDNYVGTTLTESFTAPKHACNIVKITQIFVICLGSYIVYAF